MKSLHYFLDQMNQLLNELIQVATQLRDMSFQVISEEDLAPLQKRQEELLSRLENVDQQLQENYQHQIDGAMKENFHRQLQTFQKLNQEFIQNLNASHGVIQFELRRLQEGDEDYTSRISRLKRTLPSLEESEDKEEEKGSSL
jgi:hypothetical protein